MITVCSIWSLCVRCDHCMCNVITLCAMWSQRLQCDHCSFWSLCVQSDHCVCKAITVCATCSPRVITVCAPRWLTLAPIPAGPASDSWWSRPSGPGATELPTFPTSSDNPVSMILTHRPSVAEVGGPRRAVCFVQYRFTELACLSGAKEDENSVQTYSCVASVVVSVRTELCLVFSFHSCEGWYLYNVLLLDSNRGTDVTDAIFAAQVVCYVVCF